MLKHYTDEELVAELVQRNGIQDLPTSRNRVNKLFTEVLVADGKDHIVTITLERDGPTILDYDDIKCSNGS